MFIVISYTLPLSLFRFIILNEFYPKNVAVITQVTTLLTKGGGGTEKYLGHYCIWSVT